MSETEHEHHVPAAAANSPEGRAYDFADPGQAEEALELAFDYRGDVTLTLDDGRNVEGYLFDRRHDEQGRLLVRLMLTASPAKETVPARRIRRLAFTGRDTALGKSWETWVRQYARRLAEKKAAPDASSS